MTIEVFQPDAMIPNSRFRGVHEALRTAMQSGEPATLEEITNGITSLVLTVVVNIHISLAAKATPDKPCPDMLRIGNFLCSHIMEGTREAQDMAKREIGVGATKQ